MAAKSDAPRLTDMVVAIERVQVLLRDVSLEAFEADWQMQRSDDGLN